MNENKVISTLLKSRDAYVTLSPHIDNQSFSDLGQVVFEEIVKYYTLDKETISADAEIIKAKLVKQYPRLAHRLNEYVESLPEPASVNNLLEVFLAHKRERLGMELIQAITSSNESQAKDLMDKFLALDQTEAEKDAYFNGTPLSELEVHFTGKNLIPLFPSRLNEIIGGGLPRQSQICIFARPNVGKTAKAINIAGGCAAMGYRVLYFGNEDPGPKMVYRLVSRIIKTPEHELKKDLEGYYKKALDGGYSNLFFVPTHPGNPREIRAWVEKVKPDVVVVDQIRNVHFSKNGMTVNLEQGVIFMRNLAKEFNFVSVLVTQAGDSATNKLVLKMEDVEWSNTGVAAAMDLMIGLGQNDEFRAQNKVMISIPKTKFTPPIAPFHAKVDYERNIILA